MGIGEENNKSYPAQPRRYIQLGRLSLTKANLALQYLSLVNSDWLSRTLAPCCLEQLLNDEKFTSPNSFAIF